MAMDNFPVPLNANGDFNVPNASTQPRTLPLPTTGLGSGGAPPNPITPPRPTMPYLPPEAPPSAAPADNQYGRQPINPFAGGSPTPPQFAGQGPPNYPPPMRIPSGAPAAAAPAPNPNQYVSPLTQIQNGTLPTPSMVGATPQVPSAFIGKTPNYVSPVAQIQNGTLPRPSMVGAAPQVPSAFIGKPPAASSVTSAPAIGQPAPSLNTYTPGAPRQLGQASVTSDLRAKTDIKPAAAFPSTDTSALDSAYDKQSKDVGSRFAMPDPQVDLRPAQGYTYNYKNPNAPGAAPGRQFGPMAQDLEKTPAAGAVQTGADGKKMVDTSRLSMVNTAAISEQQKRIDALTDYIKNHAQPATNSQDASLPPDWKYQPTDWSSSDVKAKTDIQPTTVQAAMKTAPASFPAAASSPLAEPVGTRERALAAGYAWLAAHGDQAAARHEQPAAPSPAEAQMAAPGVDKSMFPQGPTGIDAMQRSQFGLPTQDEADMAAIAADVERRKRTGQY